MMAKDSIVLYSSISYEKSCCKEKSPRVQKDEVSLGCPKFIVPQVHVAIQGTCSMSSYDHQGAPCR